MKKVKALSVAMAVMLAAASFSGCGEKKEAATSEGGALRYWSHMSSYASAQVSNLAETPMIEQLKKDTGIEVNFEHPPQGQEIEKFNIMIAGDNLPDIIQFNWEQNYPGGPSKAIKDKVIIDINEYKEHAPNLYAYLAENDVVRKLSTTDSGEQFAFPFVRGHESLRINKGPVLRADWLEELGLSVPETIAEWETVLKAFKEKKGATAPLSLTYAQMKTTTAFVGAFGTMLDFYIADGKVQHGFLQPQLKDFLTTMNSWYKQGLLDRDFATAENATIDSYILNGDSGAVVCSLGGGIGRYMTAAPSDTYMLVGAPYPVVNKGDTPEFNALQRVVTPAFGSFAAISTDSTKKELAAKLLDYGYSEKGRMLYNFGIEGESYEMVDGYPKYTEKITNNPDGLSMTEALALYTYAYDCGPTIQDVRYMEQYAARPEQQAAWNTWTNSNMNNHIAPSLGLLTEEVNEYASLSNAVTTYADEMILKFIMGVEPIDKFDEFVNGVKERGIEKMIEMKQSSYERYLAK